MTIPVTSTVGDVETVDIRGLSSSGAGVGTLPSGRAVFVHRTAPGDRVSLAVIQSKARWARGRLVAVDRRSDVRRTPPCPYYGRCGACTLQHVSYPAQLKNKRRQVADALRRVGGLHNKVPPVAPSPRSFRYRTRATFHVKRHGARLVFAGFNQLDEPGRILDVDGGCLVLHERLAEVWDQLRDAWGPGAVRLPQGPKLDLTIQLVDAGAVLTVKGGHGDGDPEGLLTSVPQLLAIWRTGKKSGRNLIAGSPTATLTRHRRSVPAQADDFVQVNDEAAAGLLDDVIHRAGPVKDMRVVDAYAGSGLYARELAERGARVTAIERDAPPEGAGASGITWVVGDVEEHLGAALPADLVIMNPPRNGLSTSVIEALGAGSAARLVYVSCNPATLARDLARLAPHFTITGLSVHDLFPQTSHVETVVELARVPLGERPA